MKRAELKVVQFSAQDVIATSGDPIKITIKNSHNEVHGDLRITYLGVDYAFDKKDDFVKLLTNATGVASDKLIILRTGSYIVPMVFNADQFSTQSDAGEVLDGTYTWNAASKCFILDK